MAVEKLKAGSQSTVLNTGTSLASAARAVSSTYNNVQGGGGGDGYPLVRLTLSLTFGSAPAANQGVSVYILTSGDGSGTTYEDGDASTTPARGPDCVIPVRGVGTAQVIERMCLLPQGNVKFLAINDTNQTVNSGWTLKATPITRELV
jgi:hypothetical protein